MSSRESAEKVVLTSCSYDCGARCLLKVRVKDGRIVQIGTDDRPMPSLKACVRGLAQKDVVYAPDRLTKPLRRTGKRGEGKFEPVSWDDALGSVLEQLQRVKKTYGNSAIFLMDYSGSVSPLQGMGKAARRFFSFFGGCATWWGITSYEAALFSSLVTFGTAFTGATRDNFLHSKLIILWGFDPEVTRFGPDTVHYLGEARRRGAKIVCVDPRLNHTGKALGDQWIAVRPGTDTATMVAMAYVMITENLYDRRFVETYTLGFEKFSDYVLGKEDGVAKTPEWAERITGVKAEAIEALARDYATVKPSALIAGWAPGRSAFGEQYHRAANVLSAMSGNIGITGGYTAGGVGRVPMGFLKEVLSVPSAPTPTVHISDIYKALMEGKCGGYPCDIRLLYIVGCNLLNQFLNVNKGIEALKRPEFIVVHERFMTPTARYADIVLPVTTSMEGVDIGQPWSGSPYFTFLNKAVDPLPETKSDLEIFSEMARRLGIRGYNDKSEEEWLRSFVKATPEMPDYETFRRKGFHQIEIKEPWVAFRAQVEDRLPFQTPSGKIEIYSEKVEEMNNPLLPPIPKYIEPWEGASDPLTARYPLQLVSPHAKTRVNSQFDNIAKLKSLADDRLWLSLEDAASRGVLDGERVKITNNRGTMVATAKVTDRIMPGVVSFDAGAWYRPDAQGIDFGGCVNVFTKDERSPAGGFPCNTCLVQVEKMSAEARPLGVRRGKDNRLLVAVTGGIASGKSAVSKMLEELGVPIIDYDILAREIVKPGKEAWKDIVTCFGEQVLKEDRQIDRKKLSNIVFRDSEKRKQLERFTHPRIIEEAERQADEIARKNPNAIIQVAVPLLIEVNLQDRFHKVLLVYVPRETQIERLMKRDGITREAGESILKAQWPIDEKLGYADFIIHNEGTLEETRKQVKKVWEELMREQKKRKS